MIPPNQFQIPNSESRPLLQQKPQSTFPNKSLAPASFPTPMLFSAHPSELASLFLP